MLVYSKAHRYGVNLTRLSYQEVSELVQTKTDLSEIIAENFGANATYVEGLLSRYRSNPDLVDESWRSYFNEILGDGDVASRSAQAITAPPTDGRDAGNGDRGRAAASEA